MKLYLTNQLKNLSNNPFLKKAGADTFYFTLAQVGSKLISIIALPLLGRVLNAKDFSSYDVFIVIANFLVLLVTLGTDSGLIVSLIDKNSITSNNKMFSIASITVFVTWLVALLLAIIFSHLLLQYISSYFLITALVYSFLLAMQGIITTFLRWTDKAKEASIVTFISNVSGVLVGLLFAFLNREHFLKYFVAGLLLGAFISMIIGLFYTKEYLQKISFKNDGPIIREFVLYSIPYVPGSLVNNILANVDRIIIYPLFSSAVYATYAFCSRIIQLPRMALTILGTGIQPALLKDHDSEVGQRRIKKTYEYFVLSFILILIIFIIFSKPIIYIFGAYKFPEAHIILPCMLATGLFASSIYFNGWGYTICKRTKDLGLLLFLFALINFPLNYYMAKFHGLYAMLISSLIINALLCVVYTYRSEQILSFNYNFKLIIGTILIMILLVLANIYLIL